MSEGEHHSAWSSRYSVPDYEADHGRLVVDAKTPLTAILEGELEETASSEAFVVVAARRIAERVTEDVDVDEGLLTSLLIAAISAEVLEVRARTLRTMLRYLWQDARNPWDVMKKALAMTRLIASHLICGASQTDVAFILRETKGATRAREKRTVEDLLRAWGVQGFHLEGGQKSESAREIYRQVQKGNRNRAKDKSKQRKSRERSHEKSH